MKVQETKNSGIVHTENLKPYVVIGVGVLVIAITVFQLLVGAPGNLLQSRLDKNASKEAANPGSTKSNEQDLVVDNIDSDSDGLTDTEEERIYHTDPLKPDTDGDAYKDGDEVKTGHDPKVNESGVGASKTTTTDSTYGQQYNRFIASSPDDLSNIDPTKYLSEQELKDLQSGDPSEQSIEKISSLALANTAINAQSALPNIPDSEINITSASGKQAVQQYMIAFASIMLTGAPFGNQQQLISYFVSALNGDTTKVSQLLTMAKQSESELKQVPVPKEMLDIHKKAIGILELFQQSATTLTQADSVDPTAGLTATNQLRVLTNAASDLQAEIGTVIKKYGINISL